MGGRDGSFGGGVWSIISRVARIWQGMRPLGEGVGEGIFLVWMPGTWGEPMFTSGHFFSISATGVVGGCPKWPISGTQIDGTGLGSAPGNERWSGREGQPRGSRYD